MQGMVVTIFLVRSGAILVVVVLFVLVVLRLVGIFSPTPRSCHGFSSNSYRWCQMLLSKYMTWKLIGWLEECNGLD